MPLNQLDQSNDEVVPPGRRPVAVRSPHYRRLHRFAAATAGAAVGLVVLEAVLRHFETASGPPPPRIAADSFQLRTLTRRQLEEGVAESHFSAAGARLTGAAPVPNAPSVVILGDSYVVAREVSDSDTMGAWLERSARGSGFPVNVRQYGWTGGSPARYLMAARAVMERWHPVRVVIPISDNDMDGNALLLATPQLRVDSAGMAIVLDTVPLPPHSDPPSYSLTALLRVRYADLHLSPIRWAHAAAAATSFSPSLDSASRAHQLDQLPRGVVRALSAAYGPRLTLVYLAEVYITGDDSATTAEAKMLAACREAHVTCLDTRDAMLAARGRGVVARGFPTTPIGEGHLNAEGHRLVAELVWPSLHAALAHASHDTE